MGKMVSGVMLVLLSFSAVILSSDVHLASASGTIYIRADGSIDPLSAPISTSDGVQYYFTGNISDSIVVERNDIVIDGNGFALQGTNGIESRGIDLSGKTNVTVKNAHIEGFSYGVWLESSSNNSICGNDIIRMYDGIWLWSSSGNNIFGNNLEDYYGIYVESSWGNNVSENNITNGYYGMWVDCSSGNSISKNNITGNSIDGIRLWSSSSNNSISENNVRTNKYAGISVFSTWGNSIGNSIYANTFTNNLYGIELSSSFSNISGNVFFGDGLFVSNSYGNTVENNIVNGKPLVYLEGASRQNIGEAGQVILINSEYIQIRNLNLSYTAMGIDLFKTKNSIVSGNNITHNGYGIWLESSSSNNTISQNSITNNSNGIEFMSSQSGNTVSDNNITQNNVGIDVFSSPGIIISGNEIRANGALGIFLYSSSGNSIHGNNIAGSYNGIGLLSSSNNNIYENNVTDNAEGIAIDSSLGNKIRHNNFTDNEVHASIYTTANNIWDDGYPSGGNYWGGYGGIDLFSGPFQDQTGSDGIGDTPYVNDANNIDHYPLMKPYGVQNDIGISRITPSKKAVGEGYSMNITIRILNYGVNTATFNVTVYANTAIITEFANITLAGRNSTTITFTWNTSGFATGNYTISGYATPLTGEIYTGDNNLTDGSVLVSAPCDITGPIQGIPDGQTDMRDINYIASKFGTTPLSADWDPNADVTGPMQGLPDDKVNMRDIGEACSNFGATDP